MRVFELAKKIGITSKKLIPELKDRGAEIKNHMSVVNETVLNQVLAKYLPGSGKKKNVSSRGRTMVLIKKEKAMEPVVPDIPVFSDNNDQVKPDGVEAAVPDLSQPETVSKVAGEPVSVIPDLTENKPDAGEPEKSISVEPKPLVPSGIKKEKTSEAPARFIQPDKRKTTAGRPIDKPAGADRKKPVQGRPASGGPATQRPIKVKLLELQKKFDPSQKSGVKTKKSGKKVKKVGEDDFFDYAGSSKKWKGRKSGRGRGRGGRRHSGTVAVSTVERKKNVKFKEGSTVKEFAETIGIKTSEVIKKLMDYGSFSSLNQEMDKDTALLLAEDFGVKVEVLDIVTETDLIGLIEDSDDSLEPRHPIITIMGHVDHGKTLLLDAIRNTAVADSEAGGITQHIGAYTISHNKHRMTFMDTPGHEAFTAMRARGADVTDLVLLLVAADDGVMPQTIEAINHARAADAEIMVVINKIDKPGANIVRVKSQLMEHAIIAEELGGNMVFCEVSAKKKIGIDHLLDMIQLQADMMELRANWNRSADGVIIESELHRSKGAVATVLVCGGTLKVGDVFVVGMHDGKVRTLINDLGKKVNKAQPSIPVEVTGLSGVPEAGDRFVVVKDEKTAKMIVEKRVQIMKKNQVVKGPKITLENLFDELKEQTTKELNIIIKADVHGSSEALKESLVKQSTANVKVRIIHVGVGGITETDVSLAMASSAIIIGFNVRPEPQAHKMAEAESVDVRLYTIIYKAMEDVRKAMVGLLEPTVKEIMLGRLEVRDTFSASRIGTIAGSYVLDGKISRNCKGIRVVRDSVLVFDGKLASLRRFKEDVKEVATGYECGVVIENFNDIKVGDIFEVYDVENVAPDL